MILLRISSVNRVSAHRTCSHRSKIFLDWRIISNHPPNYEDRWSEDRPRSVGTMMSYLVPLRTIDVFLLFQLLWDRNPTPGLKNNLFYCHQVRRSCWLKRWSQTVDVLPYQVSELHWEAAVGVVLDVHHFSVVGQDEELTTSEEETEDSSQVSQIISGMNWLE